MSTKKLFDLFEQGKAGNERSKNAFFFQLRQLYLERATSRLARYRAFKNRQELEKDAQDLVQDFLETVWEKWEEAKSKENGRFIGWANGVLYNLVGAYVRRDRKIQTVLELTLSQIAHRYLRRLSIALTIGVLPLLLVWSPISDILVHLKELLKAKWLLPMVVGGVFALLLITIKELFIRLEPQIVMIGKFQAAAEIFRRRILRILTQELAAPNWEEAPNEAQEIVQEFLHVVRAKWNKVKRKDNVHFMQWANDVMRNIMRNRLRRDIVDIRLIESLPELIEQLPKEDRSLVKMFLLFGANRKAFWAAFPGVDPHIVHQRLFRCREELIKIINEAGFDL